MSNNPNGDNRNQQPIHNAQCSTFDASTSTLAAGDSGWYSAIELWNPVPDPNHFSLGDMPEESRTTLHSSLESLQFPGLQMGFPGTQAARWSAGFSSLNSFESNVPTATYASSSNSMIATPRLIGQHPVAVNPEPRLAANPNGQFFQSDIYPYATGFAVEPVPTMTQGFTGGAFMGPTSQADIIRPPRALDPQPGSMVTRYPSGISGNVPAHFGHYGQQVGPFVPTETSYSNFAAPAPFTTANNGFDPVSTLDPRGLQTQATLLRQPGPRSQPPQRQPPPQARPAPVATASQSAPQAAAVVHRVVGDGWDCICGKNFTSKTGFRQHRDAMANQGRYVCGICPHTTAHPRNLPAHRKKKHGIDVWPPR